MGEKTGKNGINEKKLKKIEKKIERMKKVEKNHEKEMLHDFRIAIVPAILK